MKMALVMEDAKPKTTKKIILVNGKPSFIWDYKTVPKVVIDEDKKMGISMFNHSDIIENKDKIIYPEKIDTQIEKEVLSEHETSKTFNEPDFNPADEERSIIIDKLRDMVITFEGLMQKYLDPDIPTGRKARRKYMMERELFASNGYKEFIRSIKRKVQALCKFEKEFKMGMFDSGEEKGWFLEQCDKAINDDFHIAQEVINAVEQIVIEDEIASPKRMIITKIR